MNMDFLRNVKCQLLIILFSIFSLSIYAQEEKFDFDKQIVYEISYLTDSTDSQSGIKTLSELLLNNNMSLFRTRNKAAMDDEFLDPNKFPSPRVSGGVDVKNYNYQILKNNNGEIKVYDEYSGGDLRDLDKLNFYFEELDPQNWKITEDTLTVAGLLCQKAILQFAGRTWEAWFAADIPVQDGPYKFKGLPGLIVSINDKSNQWRFTMKEINDVKSDVRINAKKGLKITEITKEELFAQRKKYQKDLLNLAITNAKGDAELKKIMEENYKKDNNWIEIFP